jgi:hypothetical protein
MTAASQRYLLIGLVVVTWFAALARGAQDQWAVTTICGWLSLLTAIFIFTQYRSHEGIVLPLLWPFAAFFFAVLVGGAYSLDVNTTRLEITSLAAGFVSFFLLNNLFRESRARITFISCAGAVIFPLTFVAGTQYWRDIPSVMAEWQILRSHSFSHWSAPATFANSSVLAGFSLSWVILAWHRRKEGFYFQCLFVACIVCLILARSWWATLSTMVGFIYYFSNIPKTTHSKLIMRLLLMGFIVIIVVGFVVKFGPGRDPAYASGSRLSWWITGFRMVLVHPLVGVGLGAYGTAFPFFKSHVMENTLYAHSFPIQVIAETGVFGMGGVLLLVSAVWLRLSKANPISKETKSYQATLVMLLTFSLTSIFMEYLVAKLMVLTVLALALSSSRNREYYISRNGLLGSLVSLILLIPSWSIPFQSSRYDAEGLNLERNAHLPEAQESFQKALAINPYEDDSCRGLARLSLSHYEKTRSILDLSTSFLWSHKASKLKQVPLSFSEKTQ